jgi:hypothetical protein
VSQFNGDKSRWNRHRRKKIARREEMRALRKTLATKDASKPAPARASDS